MKMTGAPPSFTGIKTQPPYPTEIKHSNPLFGQVLDATQYVLAEAGKPMNLNDIKCKILEKQLADINAINQLECAIATELQHGIQRFQLLDVQPGMPGLLALVRPASRLMDLRANMNILRHQYNQQISRDKYKRKYHRLKKFIKNAVFLNASLCDEVKRCEENLHQAKEERRFLLRRVLQHEATQPRVGPSHESNNSSNIMKKISVTMASAEGSLKDKPKKKLASRKAKDIVDSIKSKQRKKTSNIIKRYVPPFPLDDSGRPIFPIVLKGLTIHSIGEIISDRPSFHSPESIYPAGFCSTRMYANIKRPEQSCLYTCKVLDLGKGAQFEISPEDDFECILAGSTPNECHQKLLSELNKAIGSDILDINCKKGSDFFGFSNATVQHLIQSSPGARKCTSYKWIKFEVNKTGTEEQKCSIEKEINVNYDALQSSTLFRQGIAKK